MNKKSGSDGSFISPPATTERRQQVFRKAWLKDPQFQLWLEETDHPLQAKCTVCVKYFSAIKNVIKHHAKSMTHSENMQRRGYAVTGPSSAAVDTTSSNAVNDSSSEHVLPTTSIDTSVAGPSSAARKMEEGKR